MARFNAKQILSQIGRLPRHLQIWLAWLLLIDFVLLLPFLSQHEARVALYWQIGNVIFGGTLWSKLGLVRLLGLSHVLFWTPMTVYLFGQWQQVPLETAYGLWLRALVITNFISLVIDYIDVVRYLKGDRAPLV